MDEYHRISQSYPHIINHQLYRIKIEVYCEDDFHKWMVWTVETTFQYVESNRKFTHPKNIL